MQLARFTFGVGDRFAHQAKAQLQAFVLAAEAGIEVVPVWNKSNREHLTVGSEPDEVLRAAREAVETLGWQQPFHVDADHIGLDTVERFLPASDFFTIDVADAIGTPPAETAVEAFLTQYPQLTQPVPVDGIPQPLAMDAEKVRSIARKYLKAVDEAAMIYQKIAAAKGAGTFITEVSMDETDAPQTPPELLVILAALAAADVPVQTIAPKFTGRFNKGVDYVGDVAQFEREFSDDVAVLAHAVQNFGLPADLKLSVHSGSDKFTLYQPIGRVLRRTGAGLHLKTAGTTWLEELIGLAESGGDGLELAKSIYAAALDRREALCAPYASVIDVDPARLPPAAEVEGWTADQYVAALRHQPGQPSFNPHLRQLLHVAYKIAAELGTKYTDMLTANEAIIAKNVTENLWGRHMQPLFGTLE